MILINSRRNADENKYIINEASINCTARSIPRETEQQMSSRKWFAFKSQHRQEESQSKVTVLCLSTNTKVPSQSRFTSGLNSLLMCSPNKFITLSVLLLNSNTDKVTVLNTAKLQQYYCLILVGSVGAFWVLRSGWTALSWVFVSMLRQQLFQNMELEFELLIFVIFWHWLQKTIKSQNVLIQKQKRYPKY